MKIGDALRGIARLGFDTAPLIYFVEKHPLYFEQMKAIMSSVDGKDIFGVSSALTLTEILTQPLRLGKMELVNRYEKILLNSTNFYLAPIDTKTCRSAADLRARYNLKTPDALQVASALNEGCDAFLTNDTGIKRVTEIQILILDDLQLEVT